MQCSVQTDEAIGLFKRSYEGCTEKSQIFYKSHKYSICYPCQQGLDYWKSSFLLNFLHNVLWAGAAVVFDGLLCIFLVRMSDALGTSLWPLCTVLQLSGPLGGMQFTANWWPPSDRTHSKWSRTNIPTSQHSYQCSEQFSIGHPVMWYWLLGFKLYGGSS